MSSNPMPFPRAPLIERLESRTMLSAMPVGPEFRVNTVTLRQQRLPSIGMDADGDFVVIWASNQSTGGNYDVYAQRYDAAGAALGGEFQVNTTSNTIHTQVVGMGSGGEFVVAWNDFGVIRARRYDAAGVAQGGDFQPSSSTPNIHGSPTVAVAENGDFMVAWEQQTSVQGPGGVFAQRYNGAGVAQGGPFRISDGGGRPRIAMQNNGRSVVTWSGAGILAQRLDGIGTLVGDPLSVNTTTGFTPRNPTVGINEDGSFIIAWDTVGQDGSDHGVYARRYDADGAPQGGEFLVNTETFDSQQHPAVAMDDNGDFTVSWDSYFQDTSGFGVYAQRYDAAGARRGGEFRVNTFTGSDQRFPAVAAEPDGDFVVAWESFGQNGAGWEVYAQRLSAVPLAPNVTASTFHFETAPQRMRFTFDQDVSASLATNDLVLENLTTAQTIPSSDLSLAYNTTTNTATVGYAAGAGVLPDGTYRATLLAPGITNPSGLPLAANHVLDFFFLSADANRDRRVNLADFNILAANFGQSDRTFTRGDFNYDGQVNLQDFNVLASRFGNALSPGSRAASLFGSAADERDDLDELS